MSTIILTTGVPGCGKTYVRCARFLVDDFLVDSPGVHWSNFPVNVEVVATAVARKLSSKGSFVFGRKPKKCSVDDIKTRIRIIPDEVLQAWRREESGPWDYFDGVDLKYAHIAIDEIHNFLSFSTSLEWRKKWDEFLGEVRHRGCTFEGITQSVMQVAPELKNRAGVRYELVPGEERRDPYFKIKMSDWYELKASLAGVYHKAVFQVEKRLEGVRWKINHVSRFIITPDYYVYYNSFNASLQEKEKGDDADGRVIENEYKRRSRLSLIFWFVRRNAWALFSRAVLIALFIWLFVFGGIMDLYHGLVDGFVAGYNAQVSKRGVEPVPAPVAVPSSVVGDLDDDEFFTVPVDDVVRVASISSDYDPICFYGVYLFLRNGQRIHRGFKFEGGILDGQVVVEVNFAERYYRVTDGRRFFMH